MGQHGKSYRFVGYDEIHGYRTGTSSKRCSRTRTGSTRSSGSRRYASLFHRPGVPAFDLIASARRAPTRGCSSLGTAATTPPTRSSRTKSPEERANPSMASWEDPGYLEQQQRALPCAQVPRLHLNLPGLPEGSAYQAESSWTRSSAASRCARRKRRLAYFAFVDMSGGSNDDAVLAIAHKDPDGRVVLDVLQDQGRRAPFDPNEAPPRFTRTLAGVRLAGP